jgi:alcohol dehydrogenase (cytochrome c)/quinohemoprotein ethanol dehydrogenase
MHDGVTAPAQGAEVARLLALRTSACAALLLGTLVQLAACRSETNQIDAAGPVAGDSEAAGIAQVDAARLRAADREPGNWMSYGRTYDEQRFSPLTAIDAANVSRLGLAWYVDLDTAARAQESTPLVIDGVMYVTAAWSKVFALDAATGEQLWAYDPQVPGSIGVDLCCDAVNRGVAAWAGRLYLGTLDGRLIALEAATGKPVWEVMTVEPGKRYSITGAPRVVKGNVIIGNGGAELGVRGYVTAYDAATGKQVWRFHTVPGDPQQPFESPALERAAQTWTGEWWKLGGGGTVWDSMAYDPELDLLYIGTGNGSPWNRAIRSPGGGDNLYLSSIVALRPDTGEYVWHYQTTPGETWDFTATQHIILATLTIDGRDRKVLMQAPKNGFFYVIDRTTGELISGEPFTQINWASGVDMKTGRPIENPEARYGETGKPFLTMPGPGGAHSWQPMSYSPLTRLVYFPVTDMAFPYIPDTDFRRRHLAWNTGVDFNAGSLPQDEAVKAQLKEALKGHLTAWDPVTQTERWRVQYDHPWNGGVLSTAGNLVFQGEAMGSFAAFDAESGTKLWATATGTGILAPPITYEVAGEQYVAIEVGWGGAFGLAAGELARDAHIATNAPRVFAFKLDGRASMPPIPAAPQRELDPPADVAAEDTIVAGKMLYHTYCGTCHGDSAVSTRVLPDLRYSPYIRDSGALASVVLGGALESRGMVSFQRELSNEDLEAIRAYVIRRAHEAQKLRAPDPADASQ